MHEKEPYLNFPKNAYFFAFNTHTYVTLVLRFALLPE